MRKRGEQSALRHCKKEESAGEAIEKLRKSLWSEGREDRHEKKGGNG